MGLVSEKMALIAQTTTIRLVRAVDLDTGITTCKNFYARY